MHPRRLTGGSPVRPLFSLWPSATHATSRWPFEDSDVDLLDELSGMDSEVPHSEALTLTGMEAMQEAFRWYHEVDNHGNRGAAGLADLLVKCRFLRLMGDGPLSPDVPAVAATHDSGLVPKFEPAE